MTTRGGGQPARVMLLVRVSPRLHQRVKEEAATRGQTMAALVEGTLRDRFAAVPPGKVLAEALRSSARSLDAETGDLREP